MKVYVRDKSKVVWLSFGPTTSTSINKSVYTLSRTDEFTWMFVVIE